MEEANYREISQQYAQGAIRSVTLINGGAAVALLSQISALQGYVSVTAISGALIVFAINIGIGSLLWLLGFQGARYVDLTLRGNLKDYTNANNVQYIAVALILGTIILFVGACIGLALSISST